MQEKKFDGGKKEGQGKPIKGGCGSSVTTKEKEIRRGSRRGKVVRKAGKKGMEAGGLRAGSKNNGGGKSNRRRAEVKG